MTGRKAKVLLIEGRDDVRQALGGRLQGLGDLRWTWRRGLALS